MKIYKISQDVNTDWDTYDSAIVIAENEEEAKKIYPDEIKGSDEDRKRWNEWCEIADVKVEYVGEAKEGLKKGVVVASYNAG
jgi:hypothetical protein